MNIDDNGHPVGLGPPRPKRSSVVPLPFRRLVYVHRLGDGSELLPDPAGLEDAPDLVVEVHGLGQWVGLGPTLEDDDGALELGEQDGESDPDGSIADDSDVRIDAGAGHAWRSG